MRRVRTLSWIVLIAAWPLAASAQTATQGAQYERLVQATGGPIQLRDILGQTITFVDLGDNGERQRIACGGSATRDGKPVRRGKMRHEVYGYDSQGNESLIGRRTRRTNAKGRVGPSLYPVNGVFDTIIVTNQWLGGRMADRVELECQVVDYTSCAAGECFADRFQLDCLPDGFFLNSPNELENGVDERWTVRVDDRCRQAGAMTFRFDRTFGNGGSFPDQVQIVDTVTGNTMTPGAIFPGGVSPGTVVPWTHDGVCLPY